VENVQKEVDCPKFAVSKTFFIFFNFFFEKKRVEWTIDSNGRYGQFFFVKKCQKVTKKRVWVDIAIKWMKNIFFFFESLIFSILGNWKNYEI